MSSGSGGTRIEKTEVVIIGAGPTGLIAAGLLARSGVKVRIFERSPGQCRESRAFGIQAKSLELFLNMGIVDRFLDEGLMATGVRAFVDGAEVAAINFDDLGRSDTPYEFLMMLPQYRSEMILAEDIARHGVTIEYRTEAIEFSQSIDGVSIRLRGPAGDDFTVECDYLIGADGAHSMVRKGLGLAFAGDAYDQGFLLADCKIRWPYDHERLKLFMRGKNLAFFMPMRDREVDRIIAIKPLPPASDEAGEQASSAEPATLVEVEDALRAATGQIVNLSDATWVTRYRIHHRGVDRYRVGRVFVAGDAAHIHSPAGAQGMNTGLQDIANLAWKIALTLRGHCDSRLLDTYHDERWPVGQKLLKFTDRLFAGMASQSAWVTTIRNMLVPWFAGTLAKSGKVRARAFHFISQLGIHYQDNFSLRDDVSDSAPREFYNLLPAGHRAPNALIQRGVDVFSLIRGYQFHVLVLTRAALDSDDLTELHAKFEALPRTIGIPIAWHLVGYHLSGRDPRILRAECHDVFDTYGIRGEVTQAIYLIRPDGYIAYRADSWNFAGLEKFLAETFAVAD